MRSATAVARHSRLAQRQLVVFLGHRRFGRSAVLLTGDRGLGTTAGTDRCGADHGAPDDRDTLALLTGLELRTQVVVVCAQAAQLDDDLVQEVIDLLLVVATTKPG